MGECAPDALAARCDVLRARLKNWKKLPVARRCGGCIKCLSDKLLGGAPTLPRREMAFDGNFLYCQLLRENGVTIVTGGASGRLHVLRLEGVA